jgi:hypothetical protein
MKTQIVSICHYIVQDIQLNVTDDSNVQQLNSRDKLERKMLRNSSQMYVMASGKKVAAKAVKLLIDCHKNCPEIQG